MVRIPIGLARASPADELHDVYRAHVSAVYRLLAYRVYPDTAEDLSAATRYVRARDSPLGAVRRAAQRARAGELEARQQRTDRTAAPVPPPFTTVADALIGLPAGLVGGRATLRQKLVGIEATASAPAGSAVVIASIRAYPQIADATGWDRDPRWTHPPQPGPPAAH